MDMINDICIASTALSVILALAVIFLERKKVKKTMEVLNGMLDVAINGTFVAGIYDESALSAVEAKLARYLSQCAVSSQNLLREKDKIKTLISDISHQTKTPIANILLYSQLLSERELPEDCSLCVQALSEQAEKLNFLISALIKASRLETGIITVTPNYEAVQKLLELALEQILKKAESQGITVTVHQTAVYAMFDLKWTSEAVFNILDNAVKYTGRGGIIEIKASCYELFCRIDISDTGMGIAEDEQSRIFSRFYRSGAVRGIEGVGIGLYLSREIVTAEGGYIKVNSTGGEGSVFSVFLPLAK